MKLGKVVAIANQKGGVGKTTVAVNLAAALAVAEKKVLVIDIDPQGNATSGLGLSPEQGEGNEIYQVLLREKTLEEVTHPTEVANLSLVPATSGLIGFEVEGIQLADREQKLARALEAAQENYDHIFIDTPPSLGLLTLNALTAAESVIVPLQAEYFALEGLSRLLRTLEMIRLNLNPELVLAGIVLTMFDRRNRLSHQVAAEVEKHFPEIVWKTRIPRNVRLSEAPSFGKPILMYDIRSVGAESFLALASEFLAKSGGEDAREKSVGEGTVVTDSDGSPDGPTDQARP